MAFGPFPSLITIIIGMNYPSVRERKEREIMEENVGYA
jgi:hypothetical protein